MAAGDLTVANDMAVGNDLSVSGATDLTGALTVADTTKVENLDADKVDGADKDTDVTLSGNSDSSVPTEKAVKTYVDARKAECVHLTGAQTIAGIKTFSSPMKATCPIFHIREEKANDTNGGTFTSGSWIKRALNTIKTNEISGASLTSGQIILPAGTYFISARACGHHVNQHKIRLRNITDNSDSLIGENVYSYTTSSGNVWSQLRGRITIATQKTFQLQHRCATTCDNVGLGLSCAYDVVEVYADILIEQIA